MEVTRIKCPKCQAQLDVKNKLNVAQKVIKCPSCGAQIMVRFKQQASPQDDGHTIYGGSVRQPQQPHSAMALGGFLVLGGVRYALNIGRNTIGRKPEDTNAPAKATVALPTNGDKTMSRLHAVIETMKMPDGSIRAIISNGENKNPTFVAGVLLNGADKLILKNGAEIRMGGVTMRYEIPV